ncbi:phage portal protein [Mesorhizobium sp. CGMCC 1.15528]|uniref:Phage portal protein n=1 Tax=Mesorhizobium zhangyense TaxID=1776730 RepID=A0A7C9RC54_9HYPH|nr:phage portal protein [Mesorhizobium zhangyense]NGN44977.1 phage portal protein [Mesorhizobium zhangyense]
MGILDLFRSKPEGAPARSPRADWQTFTGLDDPNLAPFLYGGAETESGTFITPSKALFNTAVFRCVDLISGSIGMLPMYLMRKGANGALEADEEHSLFDVLHSIPNGWQTAYEFRRLMQANALNEGNAYAQIVRSGRRVVALHPLHPSRVCVEQKDDLSVVYQVTRKDGRQIELPQSEVFHLRDFSTDGIVGLSRTRLAKEAIGLAMQTEKSAARLFKNGTMVGGALTHPGKLGDEEFENLDTSLKDKFSGAENAHKWLILEEGMKAEPFSPSARDSQQIETRNHQIEEIARAFGVPRPLLMMDDTSWGSGIETLGLFFVRYALAPWFVAWEQAVARSLLTREERKTHKADFDERELLRGSIKDQAEYLAKALGAGGSRPWISQNEARDYVGLSQRSDDDANSLKNPMTQPANGAKAQEKNL